MSGKRMARRLLGLTVAVHALATPSLADATHSANESLHYVSATMSQAHTGDALFGAFVGGYAYGIGWNFLSSESGLGAGVSFAHSRRTSDYMLFDSVVIEELAAKVLLRVARFQRPLRFEPYLGLGGVIVYLQETTIPTIILRYDQDEAVSDSDRILFGLTLEAGWPIRVWRRLGIVFEVSSRLVWLPSKETNFEEPFRIGGDRFGVGVCYFL